MVGMRNLAVKVPENVWPVGVLGAADDDRPADAILKHLRSAQDQRRTASPNDGRPASWANSPRNEPGR